MRILLCLFLAWLHVSALAANLIPNSSFELRASRGWAAWGTTESSYVGDYTTVHGLVTNGGVHGGYSIMLVPGARIQSRAVWLNTGTNTLTFSAKTLSGTQGPYNAGVFKGIELYQTVPPSIGNVTATWVRYTNTFVATNDDFHWVRFYNGGQPTILIDAVQLEAGSATAYAPMATVEAGLTIANTNNIWFAGDSPTFTLNFWNEGAAASVRANYQVFDLWNSNVVSASPSLTLAAATNSSLTIPLTNRIGWLRVVSRLLSVNDSHDELTTVVYPYASNITTHATNDWLGGHPNASDYHTRRELMVGRKWARTLSPNFYNTRWSVLEPTRGSITFADYLITNQAAAGMNMIGCLTDYDGQWPAWATNTAATTNALQPYIGSADLMAWRDYCSNVVFRFKNYIHYWELGPNEPLQSGPIGFGPEPTTAEPHLGATNLPINVRVATNYAKTLSWGIAGITNADPTAKIIGIAGASGAGEWALDVWTNLTPNIQSWISVISTHIYPQDQGTDPNLLFGSSAAFSNPFGWITTFNGIRPVWNTESATYANGGGSIKGLNALWPVQFPVTTVYDPNWEALRGGPGMRHFAGTQQILNQALRCIGAGMDKYFYYDSRTFSDPVFNEGLPYAADYQHVDRPEIVALSVATHFVRKGFGLIPNTTSAGSQLVEMYGFTNAIGQAVMSIWATDKTNRVMTLTNFVSVFDAMGNMRSASTTNLSVGRLAQYLVSSNQTLAQLTNTLKFATVDVVADTEAPKVSFDVAPSGLWDGSTNATLVKWTAIDDTWTAWATNGVSAPSATNVVYKWKLDGGAYTDNSQSNHVWLHHLSSGNHTISVTATDKNGNAAEYSYEFVPPAAVLNVSGTLNVGTITVVQ